jgi:hypothetical protein
MDEDTLIATLLKMRDGFEKAQVKNALKAKLRRIFGSDQETDWYLTQITTHKTYQERVGAYMALLTPDARKAMASGAIKSCDLALIDAVMVDTDRARRLALEVAQLRLLAGQPA